LVSAQDQAPALLIFVTNILAEPLNDNVVEEKVIEDPEKDPVRIAPPSLVPAMDTPIMLPVPVFVEAHDQDPELEILAAKIVLDPARDRVVEPKVIEDPEKDPVIIAPPSLVATGIT